MMSDTILDKLEFANKELGSCEPKETIKADWSNLYPDNSRNQESLNRLDFHFKNNNPLD